MSAYCHGCGAQIDEDDLTLCPRCNRKSSSQTTRRLTVDSRIRETLKNARDQIESFGLHFMSLKITGEYDRSLRCMADIDALLTAEPEPCEDADIDEISRLVSQEIPRYIGVTGDDLTAQIKKALLQYKDQVSDKRAEELRAQVDMLREFVAEAVQWSEAYPEHIFTAPTPEQIDAVCKTLGFRIDRIAAMVLREFTGRWSAKARALLSSTEPKP